MNLSTQARSALSSFEQSLAAPSLPLGGGAPHCSPTPHPAVYPDALSQPHSSALCVRPRPAPSWPRACFRRDTLPPKGLWDSQLLIFSESFPSLVKTPVSLSSASVTLCSALSWYWVLRMGRPASVQTGEFICCPKSVGSGKWGLSLLYPGDLPGAHPLVCSRRSREKEKQTIALALLCAPLFLSILCCPSYHSMVRLSATVHGAKDKSQACALGAPPLRVWVPWERGPGCGPGSGGE